LTAQYGARPGSGAVGDGGAVGVGDGAIVGVGDGVDVGGRAVGLAVAGATVIGIGVDVTVTGGVVHVSANSAQNASSSGRFSVRSDRMLGGPAR
jgi:hypothetical protein